MMLLTRKSVYLFIMLFISSMAVSWVNEAQANSFGRFFTTPKQRAVLDQIRRNPQYNTTSRIASKLAPVAKKDIDINGIVVRSDGINTVWINGKSNLKTNKPEVGVRIYSQNIKRESVTITLSNPDIRVTAKPGQTVDPITGKVSEVYKVK